MNLSYSILGDKALLVRFGQVINLETNHLVKTYAQTIQSMQLKGVEQIIPTYCDVTICYDPSIVAFDNLLHEIKQIKLEELSQINTKVKLLHIPVCYDKSFGIDLEHVAQHSNLSEEEVIRRHTASKYLIYMMGFAPGFTYLGGLDESIATPRLSVPREKVAAGSVGIAGKQTGMYPIETPGGWNLIGKTPLKMFDPTREPEILIQSGDYIKFYPISMNEFKEIEEKIESDSFNPKIEKITIDHGSN